MKARHWAFSGLAVGSLLFAGFIAEGQVEKNSGKRTENLTHSVPSAAAVRPVEVQPHVQKVLAADIGTRVQIIGRLGYPLGELLTIRGTWHFPEALLKDMSSSFRVLSVNGKRLNEPVEFVSMRSFHPVTIELQQIPEDIERGEEVWEVRGCETGEYLGTPAEVLRDVPKKTRKRPIQQQPAPVAFGFYTRFRYSSFKLVK